MLTGHKVPQHKGNNVTSVSKKSSKPYFSWHIQQSVPVTTISTSLYCMHQVSHYHSNLVTTPSPSILMTLASVCNQDLTCSTPSPLSSFHTIPLILGKLKIELTKNPLHHAAKNGEHFWGEKLYNGGENGEHFSGVNSNGNNTKRHIKLNHTWQ